MKTQSNNEGFSDILNIQGEIIPEVDKELDKLLKKGLKSKQQILPGSSNNLFGKKKPFAITSVKVEFDNEEDLRKCVRLLRWSDQRLLAMGSTIMWSWDKSIREGMTIKFAVNWYDKEFFEKRKDSFKDKNHLSYFNMFGKGASDMEIDTEIVK